MTLRPKLRSDDVDQLVEIELNEGAELDCEGIDRKYNMLLLSLVCESGTG